MKGKVCKLSDLCLYDELEVGLKIDLRHKLDLRFDLDCILILLFGLFSKSEALKCVMLSLWQLKMLFRNES